MAVPAVPVAPALIAVAGRCASTSINHVAVVGVDDVTSGIVQCMHAWLQ